MPSAPITNVPAEILGEIFNNLFIGTLVVPSHNFASLWSVSQICSQWREVVLGLRYLWNDVAIGAPAHWQECRPILHLANQCLLRSRGTPISVRFHESHIWDMYGGTMLKNFLMPYAAQLRCLSLGVSIDLSGLVTPALEELEITPSGPGVIELSSLIERSECTIRRLKVYLGSGLLKIIPSLEEFTTDSTLTLTSIRWMAQGTVGPALRSIHCSVTRKTFDAFIDMLASRSSSVGFSRIQKASLVLDFHLSVWAAKKIRALRDQGIEIRVHELMKGSQDSDADGNDGLGGYDSDKVCSLIFQ